MEGKIVISAIHSIERSCQNVFILLLNICKEHIGVFHLLIKMITFLGRRKGQWHQNSSGKYG